jgi:PAS domain S-box-containing protein
MQKVEGPVKTRPSSTLDSRKFRHLTIAVAAMVLGTMVGGVLIGTSVVKRFRAIESSWEHYDSTNAAKGLILSQIRKHFGFGGLIHNLKEYVIHRDPELASLIVWDFKDLRASLARYEVIGESKAEIGALFNIRQTVGAYEQKFREIKKATEAGRDSILVDGAMPVDIKPALGGMTALEIVWLESRDVETNRLNRIVRDGEQLIRLGFFLLPVLVLVVVALLWFLRHLLREVEERLRAETELRNARDKLEIRVEERTLDLTGEVDRHRETLVALEERDILLRGILANSPNEIYIKDLDGRYLLANQQFLEVRGKARAELIGKTVGDIFPPEEAARYIEHDREVLDSGEVIQREVTQVRNGVNHTQLLVKFPIRDKHGEIAALGCIGTDISVLKHAEQDLRRAMEEAELASRTKSEFLANMSHELRTPLNAVIGFSDSIKNEVFGPMENQRYAEYIDNIYESGEHLLELINDILDVSAIEAGRLELDEKELELTDVADASIRLVRSRAERGGVRLVNGIDRDAPAFFGDERRMKQIFLNLLSNGVKFTPEGGEVVLESHLSDEGALLVTVSDTGIGMDEEGLENALSPFRQGDSTIAHVHEGAGLGLPVTKGLVEAHGGFVKLESAPGKGTTVILCFPCQRVISN